MFLTPVLYAKLKIGILASMEEKDVELMVQKALEKFHGNNLGIIYDRRSQFIAKDFKKFIQYTSLNYPFTSVIYPQSNENIGLLLRIVKSYCIRDKPDKKVFCLLNMLRSRSVSISGIINIRDYIVQ